MKYDLTIFGGGTAGVAAAYIAAKYGLKTLLVEKSDVLGGSITQGLVIPCMKVDTQKINTEFFSNLTIFMDKYNARITYSDGNQGWFNFELLKIALDDMLSSVNCDVLFSCEPLEINISNNLNNFICKLNHKLLSLYIDSNYIVDATANGKIFQLLNLDFQNKFEISQTPTLRFMLSNIDMKTFTDWILEVDKDRNITTVCKIESEIYMSTAYTWDKSKNWALRPIFNKAVECGDLEYNDTAYFQVFSVPKMYGTLAFNCPRIHIKDNEDMLNPFVYSKALKQGRERIYRLFNFCKKYLPGFENAYISNISDMLGIRESYRIKGKYTYTKDDIIQGKKFDNIAFACDYPIDIHSNSNKNDKLEYVKRTYYVPIEVLISEKYDNLYCAGRILSADFEAQAALRTQMSCFSMGEAVSKDIVRKINRQQYS